ncbi:MAG TPA: fatty acid desaturase [Candidatus Limnocylindrales bacterium]|nr:fatty acid desaturase [Candidatus Limnocylindrales bacterium]
MRTEALVLPSQRLNWPTTIVLVLIHAGAIAAFFNFTWTAFAVSVFLYWMCTGLGISMGYHRLHTHRSYQVPRWMEYFFAVCGALTLEGGPLFWVAVHRLHHQKSDQPGDPHSPRDGAFWSHMGWILFGETKHNNTKLMAKYAPDVARHKFYLWLNNWHWLPAVFLTVLLYVIGGWPMMLWGSFFRIVFGLHATWAINSATHMFGARRFTTRDDSRNVWWIALFTFGEGWHNNHHAHPTSARHGLAWYEFDLSWIQIKLLDMFGLAKKIQVAHIQQPVVDEEAA